MQPTPNHLPQPSNAVAGLLGIKKRYSTEVGKTRKQHPKTPDYPSEGRLASAIALWLQTVQDRVNVKALGEAIANQNVTAAFMALNLEEELWQVAQGAGLQSRENSLQDALQAVFREGAQMGLDVLGKMVQKAQKPRIGSLMTFNFLDEAAVAFLRTYTFNLIRQITQETRLAIQAIMVKAFQKGGHPYKIAREIKRHIGLTVNQANAVGTYRDALESGNPTLLRQVLSRGLRDGRFDGTVLRSIKQQTQVPDAKVNQMVDRYRSRALKQRAQTIARTETIRASNAGTQTVWDQATAQGLLDPETTRQRWIIAFDERTCPQCKSIVRMNEKGVRLREAFQSNKGPVLAPPAHPNCRCTVALMFV